MKEGTTKGIVLGAIAWLVFIFILVNNSACLESRGGCDSGDIMLLILTALGGFGPAFFVYAIFKK